MRCEDLDALAAWADDEGGLLDEAVWLAVEAAPGGGWRLVFAAPELVVRPDPRDGFRAATRPARRWTLTPLGGAAQAPDPAPLPAEVGGLWPLAGAGAGIAVDIGRAVVEIAADAWDAEAGERFELPVVRALDPLEITWHGPGPIGARALREGFRAAGQRVDLWRNWAGSGQRFGAAFVKSVFAPQPVGEDERFGAAWRVTPAGVAAEDPRGVWLVGQSLSGAAYLTIQRTPASDPALARAACAAVDGLPGTAWAVSGNRLVEGAEDLAAWRASL